MLIYLLFDKLSPPHLNVFIKNNWADSPPKVGPIYCLRTFAQGHLGIVNNNYFLTNIRIFSCEMESNKIQKPVIICVFLDL